jgi:hypothetical protein
LSSSISYSSNIFRWNGGKLWESMLQMLITDN